ncbi:hypothetical protein ACFV0H_19945 [Streptomyces erythrochromogenes]|uniref:Uncharacterized protein n=1 Tax=Streptomyces erythrochromogenes TaxID=285574 RepID=A0ABZ1QKY5_9ACTN|nr:hypothetical protein [Streptomyces erythrochromogenes]
MSPMAGGGEERRAGPRSCPSGVCREGSALLGVMTGGGRLAYLPEPVFVDRAFADRLDAAGRPEMRYRFTEPCAEAACAQWTGTACGVIDHILDDPDATDGTDVAQDGGALPVCGIRRDCRWFAQRGAAACGVCPTVVADTGGSATYRSTHG